MQDVGVFWVLPARNSQFLSSITLSFVQSAHVFGQILRNVVMETTEVAMLNGVHCCVIAEADVDDVVRVLITIDVRPRDGGFKFVSTVRDFHVWTYQTLVSYHVTLVLLFPPIRKRSWFPSGFIHRHHGIGIGCINL